MASAKGGAAAKGGKGKGRPVDPIAQQAHLQVGAAEQPILQQIAAERAANLARAQAQMGFSKAAASIMQAAAPAVSDLYSGAANADAGYARGLGDVAQQPVDQSVAQNNAFLQKMGTPATGLETAAPIGDINYGLHGYIPATTLQREGAAWGSAAQLAPSNVLNQGQQLAGATLLNDPNLAKLQGDLSSVSATEPKVYNDLLKQAQDQAYKYASLNSTNAYRKATIGLRQQELQATVSYHQAELGMAQQRINLSRAKDQSALRLALAKGAAPDSSLSKIYGYVVDSFGNPVLGPGGKKITIKSGGSSTAGPLAGLSSTKILSLKGIAGRAAQAYFNGKDSKGNSVPKLDYQQALHQLILNGVPKPIAEWGLRQGGYTPGVRGTPLAPSPAAYPGAPGMGAALGAGIDKAISGIPNATHRAAAKVILQQANQYLGTPYVWGGESPKGFDCSGFAQFLYAKAGIQIPRTTYTQWQTGRAVGMNQLEPGDLVFFKGSDSVGGLPGHVGVYIGGGKMIDAPHTGATVRVENISSFGGYMGARRYG